MQTASIGKEVPMTTVVTDHQVIAFNPVQHGHGVEAAVQPAMVGTQTAAPIAAFTFA
jgi:hypothetical protein